MNDNQQSLREWHNLFEQGVISQEEYDAKKREILGLSTSEDIAEPAEPTAPNSATTSGEKAVENISVQTVENGNKPPKPIKSAFGPNHILFLLLAVFVVAVGVFWFWNKNSKVRNLAETENTEISDSTTVISPVVTAKPYIIEDVGDSVLFTTQEDLEDKEKFIAVPIVIYKNGIYEEPPYVLYGSPEETHASNPTLNYLRTSVEAGKQLFLLRDGAQFKTYRISESTRFGFSDAQYFSAVLPEHPQHKILTNNPKLGTNELKPIVERPVLKRRRHPEGGFYQDKVLSKVDIDGDGMPELIYECGEYEGTFYKIYSMKDGVWKNVYEGGYQGY